MSREVRVRRVYDEPSSEDGARVLVDRLWPRGLRKDDAHLDEWCKAAAPSSELRKWYGHERSRFDEFRRRYREELGRDPATPAVDELRGLARRGAVTLLTATKELDISGAAVLAEVVRPAGPPR